VVASVAKARPKIAWMKCMIEVVVGQKFMVVGELGLS
jgi:hypothetical protein